jgi:hypothetical protein
MKVCKKCGESDWVPNGKYLRCKPCQIRQRQERYKNNKDKIDAKNKIWAENNRGKVNSHKKKWRDLNKDKQSAAQSSRAEGAGC